jgi:hypothetical protein
MRICSSFEIAQDLCLYLNIVETDIQDEYVVVHGPEDNFVVMFLSEAQRHEFEILETKNDYSDFDFEYLESIRQDEEPLSHFEEIIGRFSTLQTHILLFILKSQLPLGLVIQQELASRGVDENGKWIGFVKSREIWRTFEN